MKPKLSDQHRVVQAYCEERCKSKDYNRRNRMTPEKVFDQAVEIAREDGKWTYEEAVAGIETALKRASRNFAQSSLRFINPRIFESCVINRLKEEDNNDPE
jgi:hypothetical protein